MWVGIFAYALITVLLVSAAAKLSTDEAVAGGFIGYLAACALAAVFWGWEGALLCVVGMPIGLPLSILAARLYWPRDAQIGSGHSSEALWANFPRNEALTWRRQESLTRERQFNHEADTEKRCPDCAEWIKAEARICRFCGYRLAAPPDETIGRRALDLINRMDDVVAIARATGATNHDVVVDLIVPSGVSGGRACPDCERWIEWEATACPGCGRKPHQPSDLADMIRAGLEVRNVRLEPRLPIVS